MSILNQVETFVGNYLPSGDSFKAARLEHTNLRKLILGFSQEFFRMETQVAALIGEWFPDTTETLISNWESAVGIPDSCFPIGQDLQERRDNVILKLSSLGLQTAEDFEIFALNIGQDIKIRSYIDHVPVNQGGYGLELPPLSLNSGVNMVNTGASISTTSISDYKIDGFSSLQVLSNLYIGMRCLVVNTTSTEFGNFKIHSVNEDPLSQEIYIAIDDDTPVNPAAFTGVSEGYQLFSVGIPNNAGVRSTLVVTQLTVQNSFDYDFDFPFQDAGAALLQCVLKKVKPAHCDIMFVGL